jgi:hypothetical protein
VDVDAATAASTRSAELGDVLADGPETPEAQAGVVASARRAARVHGRRRALRPSGELDARRRARARRGLPISLSVVYVEVARRAGCRSRASGFRPLRGRHFGADPPLLLDPFSGGAGAEPAAGRWCGRGRRTRPRCACSTTSSRPSAGATTSCAAIHAGRLRLALPSPADRRERSRSSCAGLESALN